MRSFCSSRLVFLRHLTFVAVWLGVGMGSSAHATDVIGPTTLPDVQTILPGNAPLIVQGPTCVGSGGCATGENFFPTVGLKLKDSQPRFKLEDATAPLGSHTSWGLIGNVGRTPARDTLSIYEHQGASTFRFPFAVETTAPDNSLYIGPNAVGFGTDNPIGNGTSIHISGPATADVFSGIGPNPNNGPAFNFGYSGFSFGRSSGFFNIRPDASAAAPNPSVRFLVQNVQAMIIDRNGNVGIGQFGAVVGASPGSSPSQKLEVQGNVKAAAFISNTTTYPDYVFKPDYKLMSLPQLSAYIAKEGHLPGVASEKEVHQQGGVNLSTLQMNLLQKVEELTLYTLQQEDTIQDQGKTITTQTKTITALRQANKAQQDALAALAARVEALERAHSTARR